MKRGILALIIFLAVVLRLFHLGVVPPSLYWDEASLGYNAFAISQTLHDEHGEFLPVARFIAFGDYKAPGYIYADALVVKALGFNEVTVRLPSALAGAMLVLVTYFVVVELLSVKMISPIGNRVTPIAIALVAALLVAISPWSLQMSRGAFEANLATLFSTLGIFLFLRSVRCRSYLSFAFCALSFALSMYSFNSHRIFVPLIIVGLGIIYFREVLSKWKLLVVFSLLLVLFLTPLVPHMLSEEGRLRFQEVSWVNDLEPIQVSNERMAVDGNAWWVKIIHNRRVSFAQQFLKHYTDNFKGSFLFFSGDVNPRLSIQMIGEMYWWELPFLLVGSYFLVRRKGRAGAILLVWALAALFPAALARETPHALRILQILPVPQIVVALGVIKLVELTRTMKLIGVVIVVCFVTSGLFYLHDYYFHYPYEYSGEWQYGYKQMVQEVLSLADNYDFVSVTSSLGRPYIYFLLYSQYPPEKYWASRRVERDAFGFWSVHGFDKYYFDDKFKPSGRGLFVSRPTDVSQNAHVLSTIRDLSGQPVFVVYD